MAGSILVKPPNINVDVAFVALGEATVSAVLGGKEPSDAPELDSDADSDGFEAGDLSWEAVMKSVQVSLLSSPGLEVRAVTTIKSIWCGTRMFSPFHAVHTSTVGHPVACK